MQACGFVNILCSIGMYFDYVDINVILFYVQSVDTQGRQAIRYSPKAGSEVVGIWRNMTVREIAEVLRKDVGM